jgi:hypothetical protein
MRQTATLLLPLLALLPQPAASQVLPYVFDETGVTPGEQGSDAAVGGDSSQEQTADEGRAETTDDAASSQEAPAQRAEPSASDAPEDAGWWLQGATERLMRFGRPAPAAAPMRFAAAPAPAPQRRHAVSYGPFRILDESHAAMVGVTDDRTPAAFTAMLRDHPQIATLEMIDCPGTEDDRANLRLGRMIRAKGIATHVPENGWVASGAVEVFLAGTQRSVEPSARFAVHSWEDDSGHGPHDYSPDAPQNRAYLDYYRAMGMSEGEARNFYAMTNSTPFSRPRYLTAGEMVRWAHLDGPARWPVPTSLGRFAELSPMRAPG